MSHVCHMRPSLRSHRGRSMTPVLNLFTGIVILSQLNAPLGIRMGAMDPELHLIMVSNSFQELFKEKHA